MGEIVRFVRYQILNCQVWEISGLLLNRFDEHIICDSCLGEEDGWYLASEIKAFWLILFINYLWRDSKASVKACWLWWFGWWWLRWGCKWCRWCWYWSRLSNIVSNIHFQALEEILVGFVKGWMRNFSPSADRKKLLADMFSHKPF